VRGRRVRRVRRVRRTGNKKSERVSIWIRDKGEE
jgi:hypothetical protein